MFAIVDCNNFYVSCERVFQPSLKGKPVIVLSNNDGCAVALSEEAKKIGVKRGVPYFKVAHMEKENGLRVFSSNYALYGDMSSRVVDVILSMVPDVEIYSIDECFIDLRSYPEKDLIPLALKIRERVGKWVGIPVSVGIAKTKTLSKVAVRLAKKSSDNTGVLKLTGEDEVKEALLKTEVGDVWGVGRKYAKWLRRYGIKDALRLKKTSNDLLRTKMGICGIRIAEELRGKPCYTIEDTPPKKKEITVSRSFAKVLTEFEDLKEAVVYFTSKAAEKLRKEGSVAGSVLVFVMTNRFSELPQYNRIGTMKLNVQTSDSSELINYTTKVLASIYKKGYSYKKTGVILKEIVPEDQVQMALFDSVDRGKSKKLMGVLDSINTTFGAGSLKYAAEGLKSNPDFMPASNMLSKSFTTKWSELLVVNASQKACKNF
jgi:DNA polymerase V